MTVKEYALAAKAASAKMSSLGTADKNDILYSMANALELNADAIIAANALDVAKAAADGKSSAMIDRLTLNTDRIKGMANGIRDIAALPDPIGEVVWGEKRPNGIEITKKRVPMGVVAIIYEARPNVTSDAAAIAIKTGNCALLRGGSEAINSNKAVINAMLSAGRKLPEGALQLIENTSRDSVLELLSLRGLVDLAIPRGGAGLIQAVVKNAIVPVIETGVGNCHVYIAEDADIDMGIDIIVNAKTSRPAVCNAAETLLVDSAIASAFIPAAAEKLREKGVELRGCERARGFADMKAAEDADFDTEFLDMILAVKVVDGLASAIAHINAHGTGHSECIVTNSLEKATRFQQEIDAACVYVNASTRFTDGGEFGFGAEIGISTQKLHARGPMGLKELTTYKYCINGNGQIR